jgi:hypothetical protein
MCFSGIVLKFTPLHTFVEGQLIQYVIKSWKKLRQKKNNALLSSFNFYLELIVESRDYTPPPPAPMHAGL